MAVQSGLGHRGPLGHGIHYQGMNSGDLDMAGSVFAEDCQTTSPYGTLTGIGAFRQMGEAFRAAAPGQAPVNGHL